MRMRANPDLADSYFAWLPIVTRLLLAPAPTNHEAIGCLSVLAIWGVTKGIALVCK
jgi:hypothetical protein